MPTAANQSFASRSPIPTNVRSAAASGTAASLPVCISRHDFSGISLRRNEKGPAPNWRAPDGRNMSSRYMRILGVHQVTPSRSTPALASRTYVDRAIVERSNAPTLGRMDLLMDPRRRGPAWHRADRSWKRSLDGHHRPMACEWVFEVATRPATHDRSSRSPSTDFAWRSMLR